MHAGDLAMVASVGPHFHQGKLEAFWVFCIQNAFFFALLWHMMRASMPEITLQTSVQFLRGVGPQRAELLGRLGLVTVADLLYFLPRDVLDLTHVSGVHELSADKLATVRGRVVDRDARLIKGGRTMTAVLLECDGQFLRGVWFNSPWMLQKFHDGDNLLFSGKPKKHA